MRSPVLITVQSAIVKESAALPAQSATSLPPMAPVSKVLLWQSAPFTEQVINAKNASQLTRFPMDNASKTIRAVSSMIGTILLSV